MLTILLTPSIQILYVPRVLQVRARLLQVALLVVLVVTLADDAWYVSVLLVLGRSIHLGKLVSCASGIHLGYSRNGGTLRHRKVIVFRNIVVLFVTTFDKFLLGFFNSKRANQSLPIARNVNVSHTLRIPPLVISR